ncbi:hypothetical protein [Silvibacterium acidisoli]|uniref:hypothetical protein n=1 Tax=Acidobacteriaceae bacterium ZG23-2 TaxID=2883246 RepID=UPI00406C9865
MQIHLSPERQAQLSEYARRHDLDVASAVDDLLGEALESERLEHQQSVAALREGLDDMTAGRVAGIEETFRKIRAKHGL